MTDFTGDSGDNSILGTADADTIDFSQGGEDTVAGGAGGDTLTAGGALDAGDQIDGGEGSGDVVFLGGDYSLVFADTTMTGVENVILETGHDYDLTLADATAAVEGGQLRISASTLAADDHVRVDASALQSDHSVFVSSHEAHLSLIGGAGADHLIVFTDARLDFDGGGGDDHVDLLTSIDHHDRLNGGEGGADQLMLQGGGVDVFTGKMAKGFEQLILFDGDFQVTMADGNLRSGGLLNVSASSIQHLVFDASAERSGAYSIYAGQDSDTVTGGSGADFFSAGSGDDVLIGGRGGDQMYGGVGADSFVYVSIADSGHHKQFDLISDLDASDHIDLSAIDANTTSDGDQHFHLVSHFKGAPGELVLSYDADAGVTTLAGDVDGDGEADIAIHIAGDQTGFTGIVL